MIFDMEKIEIIPATDIIAGKVVRLTQGRYDSAKVYYDDPLDAAKAFEDCGLRRLHIVDLDGAANFQPMNLKVLERIATKTSLSIQYGGGIKNADALHSVFDAGASRAICGSIAATNPDTFIEWMQTFGPERLVLGADVRDGLIAIKGWKEQSSFSINDLLTLFSAHGLKQSICTDIARDGMLCGPSVDFYVDLQERFPQVEMTVSGGISSMADIENLSLSKLKSVIVGKAFYEGKITIKDLERWSLNA